MGNGNSLIIIIKQLKFKNMTRLLTFISLVLLMASCQNKEIVSDAFGNFESDKTIISSEAMGKILRFEVEEGDLVKPGQEIGLIDTLDLHLKKLQLEAQIKSVAANSQQIFAQAEVQKQQLANILVTKTRIEKLIKEGAATQQQLDDVSGQYDLTDKQISATETQNKALQQQLQSMDEQIKQIELAIDKCNIINPVEGTVLSKLSMKGEITSPGKPLYTIANLDYLKLKAYVSGDQLGEISIGKKVKVLVDGAEGKLVEHEGTIVWVSETSEFTPKTIQTREDRVNLVYAIKVKVKNDGSLKIGMPGEVSYSTSNITK